MGASRNRIETFSVRDETIFTLTCVFGLNGPHLNRQTNGLHAMLIVGAGTRGGHKDDWVIGAHNHNLFASRQTFTPASIQQMRTLVERGKRREEIAELIGVTVGSLQVTCSRLGISLRRPASITERACCGDADGMRLMRPRTIPLRMAVPRQNPQKSCLSPPYSSKSRSLCRPVRQHGCSRRGERLSS